MPLIAGLDLSLTSTGVSLDGVTLSVCVPERAVPRLIAIRRRVLDFLRSHAEIPLVCIEGYSFGSKNSQAHAIGELGGVIRVALFEHGIPFVDVPPTCRAKFATGKGNAGKSEVVSAVSARTGIIWSGKSADDLCDAWVLEEMGRAHFGAPRFDWPKSSLEALEKVDWSPFDLEMTNEQ